MSNQFWGHRVNLLLKSLVKSFVLCIALRVIKFFAVCQQFPFLYVNCFNRPAKESSGTFLDLLQNISFLFLHEWILILVKWDEKIAFLVEQSFLVHIYLYHVFIHFGRYYYFYHTWNFFWEGALDVPGLQNHSKVLVEGCF